MYWVDTDINRVPTIRLINTVIPGFVDGVQIVRLYFVDYHSYYEIYPGILGINEIFKRLIYAMHNCQVMNERVLVSPDFCRDCFDPVGSVCCEFDEEQ